VNRDLLVDLIEASDFDGLIRFIDGVCDAREWEALAEIRHRCVQAETRGKQLFGVVQFVDYRQALEAPAELACEVLGDGAGRFALGPLWEVAASTHTWDELEPYVTLPRMRALIATERALRGDAILDPPAPEVLGTPFVRLPWEPVYPAAVYRSDRADFPAPDPVAMHVVAAVDPLIADDADSEEALFGLVRTWVEESNGLAHVATVEGDARAAISAVCRRPTRGAEVPFGRAMATMAWAGANGGAYGSRRGSAVGRSAAWAVVGALADLDWPPEPADVEVGGSRMTWWVWEPQDRVGGWHLGVAAADPLEGLAWAVHAYDEVEETADDTRH
jgi:hypothetical protein